MRNLKRALCFALAAVMVLGLMITGAGAASTYDNFTDKDEIVHQEAVNTMVSLGVINGKEDGSYYDPTATVTRAEMTKVVAVALNGGKDPVFSDNDKTTFSDTQGHWAEKYIAYCVRQGIVAGRGDNSFGPDDPLTGSACAKMFLCALGYRADLEGFVNVGSDWELNVNVKANQDAKLYDELSEITASDDLTRDSMAQMLYNAVQANEVIYDNLYGDYSGVIQAVPNGTMLANRFGVAKVEGVVVANEIVSIEDDYGPTVSGKIRLADIKQNGTDYTDSDGNKLSAVYPVGLDNEYLGQRVVLYVKGLKDLSPNASNMTLVGEPILSDDNTVAETANRLKDASAVRSFLSDNGLTMPDGTITNGIVTGTVFYSKDNTDRTAPLNRAFAVTSTSNVNGTELTFIDHNGDGQVDYIFKTLPQLAKVTVYNEKDEELTIAGQGSIDFSDIANHEDVAKDDIVLYHKMGDTWYMNVAETVSGKVTAYNDNNKKVTVDGEDYGRSTVGVTTTSSDLEEFSSNMDFVENSYTFYLDNHGNVVAYVLDESSLGNLALVLSSKADTVAGFETGSVRLLLPDNTTGTYDVNLLASANRFEKTGSNSKKEGDMATDLVSNGLANTIVTYVIAENGRDVTIGDPDKVSNQSAIANDGTIYTSVTGSVARSTSRYTFVHGTAATDKRISVNDSTIFFIRNITDKTNTPANADEYTVVNGLSNMPTSAIQQTAAPGTPATLESAVFSYSATTTLANQDVAKAVLVDGYYKGTSSYVFLTDKYTGTETVNGERVYSYPAVFEDGHKDVIKSTQQGLEKNMVYEYTMENTGYANLVATAPVSGKSGVVNQCVTTYTKGSNFTVEKGDGSVLGAGLGSHTMITKPNVWNVEDDEPVAETLSKGMSVGFVLDGDGFVKTVFVYDTNVTKATITSSVDGISVTNPYVYSGFDAEFTGFTPSQQATLKYTVGYGSRNEEKTLTTNASGSGAITIEVPDNAVAITLTEANGVSGGGGGGGGGASGQSLTFAATGDFVVYADDSASPLEEEASRGGVTVKIPDGTTSVSIQKKVSWTAGNAVGYTTENGDHKAYVVDSDKCITIDCADLAAGNTTIAAANFKDVYKLTVPTGVTAAGDTATDILYVNGTDSYFTNSATVKLTGVHGLYYTIDDETSFVAKASTFSMPASATEVKDDYYAIGGTVIVTATGVTNAGGAAFGAAVTTPTAVSGKHYFKNGESATNVTITLTATNAGTPTGDVTGVVTASGAGYNVTGTGMTAAKLFGNTDSIVAGATPTTYTLNVSVAIDSANAPAADLTLGVTLADD